MARYVVAVMHGLAIQARDGFTLGELQGVAVYAVHAISACGSTDD